MGLTNEHVGPKILAKIKIYVLIRAELLFTLCYEIPCRSSIFLQQSGEIRKPLIPTKYENFSGIFFEFL